MASAKCQILGKDVKICRLKIRYEYLLFLRSNNVHILLTSQCPIRAIGASYRSSQFDLNAFTVSPSVSAVFQLSPCVTMLILVCHCCTPTTSILAVTNDREVRSFAEAVRYQTTILPQISELPQHQQIHQLEKYTPKSLHKIGFDVEFPYD